MGDQETKIRWKEPVSETRVTSDVGQGEMSKKEFHIILIDDYLNGLETFRDLLQCWGYTVKPISRGREALKLLDNGTYDLVITSLTEISRIDALYRARKNTIPEMTNMEVLKAVKRKNPAIPVMMFAPYGSADSAKKAMRQGAADYVRRPFSLEDLKSRIESVLTKSTDKSGKDHMPHS